MSDTAGSCSDAVDRLLLEAGLDDDGQLGHALLELRALADTAPEPGAAVAALLPPAGTAAGSDVAGPDVAGPALPGSPVPAASVPGPAETQPVAPEPARTAIPDDAPQVDELAARRRAKRRIALTTFGVAVSLSAGGAVAAASDHGIRESFTQLNHLITSFVTSPGAPPERQAEPPAAPLPAPPPAGTPAGAADGSAVPAHTAPGGPASIPPDPAAAQPGANPPPTRPAEPEATAGQPASPEKPGDVPASGILPGAGSDHLGKGLGKAPEVPAAPQVPLPGTLPAVPLP